MESSRIDFDKVTNNYFGRLSTATDTSAFIMIIHLSTEYCINKLIATFSPKPKEILNNINYTYSIKLCIVYNMGLIDDDLYFNLKKLNSTRNKFSHEWEYTIDRIDLNYKSINDANLTEKGISAFELFKRIGLETFEPLLISSTQLIEERLK